MCWFPRLVVYPASILYIAALQYIGRSPLATVLGWQSSPQLRGTWQIIWNCIQTILLCAWVSVCPNAPAPVDGKGDLITDKFFFILLTLLGPDLVFMLAFGQWRNARASLPLFHASGYTDWTMTHAFIADMGGIHVKPPNWKSFPVNAKQLHFLVQRKYMDYPCIKKDDIEALGKTDVLARLITIVQASAFMATTLARFGQNLAVTTLELTVLANICCTLATYLCWWSKPNSIETSHFHSLNVPIEDIVRDAGNKTNESYRDTPLDFVSRNEWSASRLWNYYVNILRHLGLLRVIDLHFDRPAQRINTFNWPKPGSRRWAVFLYLYFLAYTAIFLAPWNFHFPTPAESWVWRTAALVQSGITVAVGVFEILWYDLPVRCSSDSPTGRGEKSSNQPLKGVSSMDRLRDF